MNIIGTGLSGLVGSRVVELLSPEFTFENLSLETGIDITNKKITEQKIFASDSPWVFHFAAYTDVDRSEQMRSDAWNVNVEATRIIVEACRKSGKKLLYISTDFVFDGTKDRYSEKDAPHPLGWYAQTKYEGEKLVSSLGQRGLIIRISFPYALRNAMKPDFVHKIIQKLKNNERISSPEDQLFVPTFIDDIAQAIQKLVTIDASGVYHVVGSQALSPFVAAQKIAHHFGFQRDLVTPVPFASFYQGRAPRPFHAVLANDKITQLGITMSMFDEGLKQL